MADVFSKGSGTGNATARLCVTTANKAHSTLAAVDTKVPVDGDIIFDPFSTVQSSRGLWVAHAGAWKRPSTKLTAGMLVTVFDGSARKNSLWILDTPNPIILDTTNLTFQNITTVAPALPTARLYGTGVTLSGIQTMDGFATVDGDTVYANGNLYTVNAAGAWTLLVTSPAVVFVTTGTNFGPLLYGGGVPFAGAYA